VFDAPATRYVRDGDLALAYQVAGEGPLDLFFATGGQFPIDLMWELPGAVSAPAGGVQSGGAVRLQGLRRVENYDRSDPDAGGVGR
jgi:hypothetical protein